MADKETFAVRLPEDSAEAVEGYVEGRDVSQADAMRRAIDEYFVEGEPGPNTGQRRRVGGDTLRTLAAVLLGGGIVLAAATGSGGLLTAPTFLMIVGATLFAVQHKLTAAFGSVLDAFGDLENPTARGSVVYLWSALKGEHPAPRNPVGVVEKAAWADLYGLVAYVLGSVVMALLAVPVYAFGTNTLIDAVGATILFRVLVLIMALLLVGSVGVMIGSLAQITLETATGDAVKGTPTET